MKICEFDGATFAQPRYGGDKGAIAVQVHGGNGWPKGAKVRWKNIKIKPL